MQKSPRKFIARNIGGRRKLLALAERDEVIAPGHKFTGRVNTTFKVMKAGGAVMVVVKIIFACPEKLHGNADSFGYRAGFEHVIVGEAPAEAPTGALHMHDDVVMRNA